MLSDVNRARDDVLATFSARDSLHSGAAALPRFCQTDTNGKIAQQSRDVAINHVGFTHRQHQFAIAERAGLSDEVDSNTRYVSDPLGPRLRYGLRLLRQTRRRSSSNGKVAITAIASP